MMNTSDRLDELDWLAFQYVADELGDIERDAFESRMEEDQAACEAVVSAMKLAQAVDGSLEIESQECGSTHAIANPATPVNLANRDTTPKSQIPATGDFPSFKPGLPTIVTIAATIAAAIFGWWAINQPATGSIDNHGTVAIAWADSGEDTNWDHSSAEAIVADVLQSDENESSIQDVDDDLLLDSDDEWLLVALVDIANTNSESVE